MSTTFNFNLPLLTATQAGKEVTVNQALTLIDSILAASGTPGSTSTLTAEELAALFLSPSQLTTLIDAELAKLPVPVTAAQLASALAGLPSGVTLAQLQTELANLPASSGGGITLAQLQGELNARPVPATVADVQAAVATISVGGSAGGGISLAQLQAELAKLTPAAFASNYTKLGVLNNTQVKPSTVGAYPSVVYSAVSDRFYYLDYGRGFVEFDLNTQLHTPMPNPPLGQPGYTTGTPSLSVLPSGKILYSGANSGLSGATKSGYQFNPAAGSKAWDTTIYNSVAAQSFGTSFRAGSYTLVYGGTLAGGQLFDESAAAWSVLDNYQLPTSYTVDGTSYAGYSAAKSCSLPSGSGLLLLPTSNTAGSAYTALKVFVDTTPANLGNTTATPTSTRFPTNSTCIAVASTSYGAVALVRERTALTTRFYKFVEATGVWSPMTEGLGAVTAAAMAANAADQVLVVTESGSNPGIYLLNAA